MIQMNEISNNVIIGAGEKVNKLVQKALDEKQDVDIILKKGLIAGMSVVGERFKNGEMYIPEVMLAARCMKDGMEILKPFLSSKKSTSLGTIVIGTVKGDLHDIGKNLVMMMLEGAGFDVIDLGVDVPNEKFVAEVKEKKANILAMSALLTTTMSETKEVIKILESSGLRHKVKVMVGGAPITEAFTVKIGADAYARDAGVAVDRAKEILNIR